MNLLLRQKTRGIKPGLGAMVDWGHPLAIGLDSCLLFNEASVPRDIGGSRRWTVLSGTAAPFKPAAGTQQIVYDASDLADHCYQPNKVFVVNGGANVGWTVRCRAKLTSSRIVSTVQNATSVAWCCGNAGGESGFCDRYSGSINVMSSYSSSGSETFGTTANVANVWYDFVWAYDGTNMTMYKNGRVDKAAFAFTSASATGINSIFNTTSAYNTFGGWCDIWQHWNRRLSAAEISWLYMDPYAMILGPRKFLGIGQGLTSAFSLGWSVPA